MTFLSSKVRPDLLDPPPAGRPSVLVRILTRSAESKWPLRADLLKEYRKLDDSITMRLNRTNAQFRDRDRLGAGGGKGNVQDQACAYIWKDLVENWKRRAEIIDYCVAVVDESVESKKQFINEKQDDPKEQRKMQGILYEEAVKRNQVRNELTVEKIVRQRSLDAFTSRCRYFTPPLSDVEARKWWDAAQSGQ
ncbi:hypothetical protein EVG20_g26 [Dentipellis fragilis]|uniref:Uncharacterized protein n=1 Tax=Dentipellis fragilis TaxID=205917 RepID=A0A4Y9ZGK3_9AGAM|nr:hypothetical protein EVG20_g26 [Dentipellis fragilis]